MTEELTMADCVDNVDEPDNSTEAAAEVVDAMAVAEIGSG